jgi:protoporphyrinogen IX oxidase
VNLYLLFKSLHLISLISWMVGLLYLPRLFVYHTDIAKNSDSNKIFKLMEFRLYRYICTPAMIATFIFGILLILQDPSYYMKSGWLHFKLLLVFALAGIHGFFGLNVKIFAADQNQRKAKFFRIINEVPTILMILIIFLAFFKPF